MEAIGYFAPIERLLSGRRLLTRQSWRVLLGRYAEGRRFAYRLQLNPPIS